MKLLIENKVKIIIPFALGLFISCSFIGKVIDVLPEPPSVTPVPTLDPTPSPTIVPTIVPTPSPTQSPSPTPTSTIEPQPTKELKPPLGDRVGNDLHGGKWTFKVINGLKHFYVDLTYKFHVPGTGVCDAAHEPVFSQQCKGREWDGGVPSLKCNVLEKHAGGKSFQYWVPCMKKVECTSCPGELKTSDGIELEFDSTPCFTRKYDCQ